MAWSADAQGIGAIAGAVAVAGAGWLRLRKWLKRSEARRGILWGRPAVNGTPATRGLAERTYDLEMWKGEHIREAHRATRSGSR